MEIPCRWYNIPDQARAVADRYSVLSDSPSLQAPLVRFIEEVSVIPENPGCLIEWYGDRNLRLMRFIMVRQRLDDPDPESANNRISLLFRTAYSSLFNNTPHPVTADLRVMLLKGRSLEQGVKTYVDSLEDTASPWNIAWDHPPEVSVLKVAPSGVVKELGRVNPTVLSLMQGPSLSAGRTLSVN